MANGRFHLHVNGTNYIVTGSKNLTSYKDILCTIAKENDSETDMNNDESVEIQKVKAKKTKLQSSCNRGMLKKNKRRTANAALSLPITSKGGGSCKKNVKRQKQEKRNREADQEYTIEDSDTETFHRRRTKMKSLMAARWKDGLDKFTPNHTKTAHTSLLQKTTSKNQFGEQLSHFDKISIYAIDETSLKRASGENIIKDTEYNGASKCKASSECEANQSRRSNKSTEEVVQDDKDSGVPSLESEDQLPKDEIRAEQWNADKEMKPTSCETFQINRNLTQESEYACPCIHPVQERNSTTSREHLAFRGQAETGLCFRGHRRGQNNDIRPRSDEENFKSSYQNLFLTFHSICNKDGKDLYCKKQNLNKGIRTICNSTKITNAKNHLKMECTIKEKFNRHIVSRKKSIRASKSKRTEDISTNSNCYKIESKLKTIANPAGCLQKPGDHGNWDVRVAGLKNGAVPLKNDFKTEEQLDMDIEKQLNRFQGSSIKCTEVNGSDENNNEIGNRSISAEHKSECTSLQNDKHACRETDEIGHDSSEHGIINTERNNIWDRYNSVCQSIVEISERLLYFDLLYEQLTTEITQIEMQENLADNDTLEYEEQMIIKEIIGFKKNLKEITLLSRRQRNELLENRKDLIRLDTILKERKSILGYLQEFVFVQRIQSAPRQLRKSNARKRKVPNI